MQKTLKNVLILTTLTILLLTTACSQAAVGQEKTTSPASEKTQATELKTEPKVETVSESEKATQSFPISEEPAVSEPTVFQTSSAVAVTTAEEVIEEQTEEPEPPVVSTESEKPTEPTEPTEPAKSSESTETAGTTDTEKPKETSETEGATKAAETEKSSETTDPTADLITIEDTKIATSASEPEPPSYPEVSAPGTLEERNSDAVIDYSNTGEGYVMAKFTSSTSNRLKALVVGPTTQYQYNLEPGEWSAFPLSDGDGTYQIGIYENVKGTSYAQILVKSIKVKLDDEFAPFLRSNQYVNFEAAPDTVSRAAEVCEDLDDTLEKVAAIYDEVVGGLSYDYDFADRVKGGSITSYVPDLDSVLENKKGICLDYAGLMSGMLRSQCIPCKLVVGYTGTNYHAWISVWTEEDGWIDNAIYFDGENWQRMDPTFASTGKKSETTMKYIGNGKNYVAKFFY